MHLLSEYWIALFINDPDVARVLYPSRAQILPRQKTAFVQSSRSGASEMEQILESRCLIYLNELQNELDCNKDGALWLLNL